MWITSSLCTTTQGRGWLKPWWTDQHRYRYLYHIIAKPVMNQQNAHPKPVCGSEWIVDFANLWCLLENNAQCMHVGLHRCINV